MKRIMTIVLLAFVSVQALAQLDKVDEVEKGMQKKNGELKEGWNKAGLLNIGLNQAMLQNWAAGGERYSLAINGVFNGYAVKLNGNKLWENTLDLFYGLNYVESNNFVPRKIDDRIDFSTRYGVRPNSWENKKILKHTYLMGLFRMQTQFSKGFDYSSPTWNTDNSGNGISNFFSPAYFTLALGAEYRPNEKFSVFFSPLAARIITASTLYTTRPGGAFGIDSGKTLSFQFGAYLSARYQTALTNWIDYRTRLDLYSNYLHNPKNIDVLWDNFFGMKFGKYIGAGLGITLMYDDDVPGKLTKDTNNDGIPDALGALGWTQLKQVLNIGFNYKF